LETCGLCFLCDCSCFSCVFDSDAVASHRFDEEVAAKFLVRSVDQEIDQYH